MQSLPLERRNFLGALAGLLGVAALPAGALAAPAAPALSKERMQLIAAVAESYIPRTDTPGAADVGVPGLFAAMLANWAAPDTKTAFLGRLDAIDAAARAEAGKPFAKLTAKQRNAVLKAYDAANFAAPDYKRMRDLFVILYYNSEPGATVELRYEHAPGPFEPSIPMTAQTRAWAGMSFF